MSETRHKQFAIGDAVWLPLTDKWLQVLRDYDDMPGNEVLLARCEELRLQGRASVRGTVCKVNVSIDETGYAHYDIQCSDLGDDPIGVDHDEIEPDV